MIRLPELDQVERVNYPEKITCPLAARTLRWLSGIEFVIMEGTLANIRFIVKNWLLVFTLNPYFCRLSSME